MLKLPDALVLFAAALATIAYASLARGEPVTWAVPADETLDTFELCTDAGCAPLAFARWHVPDHELGDVWLYRADAALEPGVRAWVRGREGGVGGPVVDPASDARVWCSPWDFTGDGTVGARDYARYLGRLLLGREQGGAGERAELMRVFSHTCATSEGSP